MIRLATVFSGIGSIEWALNKLNIEHEIIFACDNGERNICISDSDKRKILSCTTNFERKKIVDEIYASTNKENFMEKTYRANYNIREDNFYQDITFINGNEYKGEVDLFVGGSPCQSFSINGKRGGFADTRGTLFYEYARLIREIQPKCFIYENVKGMLTHDSGRTWQTIKNTFDELNYDIYIVTNSEGKETAILNSYDYGIPQNRPRLYVVGFHRGLKCKKFKFPQAQELKTTVFDYLDTNVDAKYYLGRKGFEFVTTHPSRAQVSKKIMRCQKANQQFNWNGDFIFVPIDQVKYNKDIMARAYVGEYNGEIGVIRQITPRECLRLMGYSDEFKIVVNDNMMYRQAGNSIVVDVLENIFNEIEKTGVFND